MQFGKSLARLANDIAAGYGARNEIAVARATSLSALNAATQQTLSDNTRHRAGVARELAATAADLRQRLAAGDAALEATVQTTLTAARQDLAAKRQTIADNARALRANLDASRRKASAALTAFRSEVRTEQAATAAALSESLASSPRTCATNPPPSSPVPARIAPPPRRRCRDSLNKFIAGVQSETASIKADVQDQFRIARAAWGHATVPAAKPAAPAPAAKAAAAPSAPPVQARPAAPPAPPAPPPAAEAAPAEPAPTTPVRHRKRDAEKAASDDEQPGSTRSFGSFN